jgi:TetR/AcrR family transcriptional regulator, mexJK operon transcriptional repressor
MNAVAEIPLRGRPRDLAKREKILVAARQLFLNFGPGSISMEQIAAEADVAKATLYANFKDKTALLTEIVKRESERLVANDFARVHHAAGVEEALRRFGEQLLGFLSDPEMLAMERLAAGSRAYAPTSAQAFFEAGVGRAMAILRALIANGNASGLLDARDLGQASEDLIGLWEGMLRVEMNFLARSRLSPEEISHRAARGVAQFMRLYRANPAE